MHVLLIHQAFAAINEPGGTRHHEIARFLAKHGHSVTIITSSVSYLTGRNQSQKTDRVTCDQSEPGITILRAYTPPALHRSFFHRLLVFFSFMFSSFFIGLRVKNVSVVWGTSPPIFQGGTAWLLARMKRVPFVFEVRDLWPAFAVAVGVLKNPLLVRLSEGFERFLYRHADAIVVNSPGFIEHIRQRGGQRIHLVENGVDASMFDPTQSGKALRKTHHLEGKFIVLYAGAHGISNNLGVILQAAKSTLSDPSICYLFLGDGKEKATLVAEAQSQDLTNVLFLPSVSKDQMNTILCSADACVAILKPIEMYKTTYPNKVFDYMAAGKPILLMIDGVIREVVENAECGVFIKPDDANQLVKTINVMKQNPFFYSTMGRNGRRYVEKHFNRALLAKKMEEILQQNNENDEK